MDSLKGASSEILDMPQTQEPEMAQELEVDAEPEDMLYDEQPLPTEDESEEEQLSPEMAWKLLDEKKARNLFCLRYFPEKRLFLFRWTFSEELNNLFSLKSGQLSHPFVVHKEDWSRETASFAAAKEALEKAKNLLPSWTFACPDLEKIEVEHKLPQLVRVMISAAVGFKLEELEVLLAAPRASWGKAQMKDLEDVTRMLKKKNSPQQNKEIVASYLSQRL
jgi:phosphopantetheinyl transferase (holo-ACP synthase)